jgi:hypothetical protein
MPQDRVQKLEWDRRYLSVLGVENKRLYELRLQTPEQAFMEENDMRSHELFQGHENGVIALKI